MSQTPDYYAALHIPHDATRQQISRAYRALMRNHHPDMEGGRATSGVKEGVLEGAQDAVQNSASGGGTPPEAELLRIMQAFAVLRDPARRAAYDREIKAHPAVRAVPASQAGTDIPVRKVRHAAGPGGNIIRITPVRWESGPWA
ncbi:J domain-containing protein [Pseudarthrobacter sp. R1]|uniref:J domain-containing protein n=1 Tax=Pseudarthrobacter sp. R1 TaxID=2944934 RepID=UPI00210BF968|nr:J domain-containing protein [Pseudarthrobacter sp. R1]MCQ6273002.1 J domain-containing protein [Pseudarthrobacter sp. R1]